MSLNLRHDYITFRHLIHRHAIAATPERPFAEALMKMMKKACTRRVRVAQRGHQTVCNRGKFLPLQRALNKLNCANFTFNFIIRNDLVLHLVNTFRRLAIGAELHCQNLFAYHALTGDVAKINRILF